MEPMVSLITKNYHMALFFNDRNLIVSWGWNGLEYRKVTRRNFFVVSTKSYSKSFTDMLSQLREVEDIYNPFTCNCIDYSLDKFINI